MRPVSEDCSGEISHCAFINYVNGGFNYLTKSGWMADDGNTENEEGLGDPNET